MANAKSNKKASLIILTLVLLGASSTYFIYNNTNEATENELKKVEETVSDVDAQTDQDDSIENEEEIATAETSVVLASVTEPLATEEIQPTETKDNLVEKSEANKSEKRNESMVTEVVENNNVAAEVIEKIEVKPSEKLVENQSSEEVAEEKIEKIDIDETAYDPFNLIISSEVKDSDIFEKYDYGIYINSVNQLNGKIVDGDIQVYDNVRSKKITTIKTHTLAGINDPNNRNQSVRIISAVFGYRPQEISFNLHEPAKYNSETESSVIALSDSVIRVDLNLERLQAGDIAVMWQVFFFKDAAIMQPKSKPELEDLFLLMNENPKMKIKLHGHTNGNSHGKVIHLGEKDNHDLFNLKSPKHVETVGSAQKLSLYRAETIQHYLISKGIDQSRIEIKGWGGKKMLHDKHSAQANLNVRVEVEILEN